MDTGQRTRPAPRFLVISTLLLSLSTAAMAPATVLEIWHPESQTVYGDTEGSGPGDSADEPNDGSGAGGGEPGGGEGGGGDSSGDGGGSDGGDGSSD